MGCGGSIKAENSYAPSPGAGGNAFTGSWGFVTQESIQQWQEDTGREGPAPNPDDPGDDSALQASMVT